MMNNTILNEIKKQMGIADENTDFDKDIRMLINAGLMILEDNNIKGNVLTISETTTCDEFMETSHTRETIFTWLYTHCRLLFDPPTSSTVVEALISTKSELLWRLRERFDKVEGGSI